VPCSKYESSSQPLANTYFLVVGCNSGDYKVRDQIGHSITALGCNRDTRELPSFYCQFVVLFFTTSHLIYCYIFRYIQAQHWEHLATAAYESFDGSAVDQMICLVQKSKPYSHQIEKGLVALPYKNEADLFSAFTSSSLLVGKSTSRAIAPTLIPESASEAESQSHTSEVASSVGLGSKDTAITTSLLSVEDMRAPIPEEEIRAALVIQSAYRKARRRVAVKETDEVFKKWYNQCAEMRNTLLDSRTYQMYLLGPLPHVLVWADAAVRCLKSRRDSVRAKFKGAFHTEIEELSDHLNMCR
jgi:hypothetical protein